MLLPTLQDSTGLMSAEKVCETCFQYNLPLTLDQLSLLVWWCGSGEKGAGEEREVRYRDLVELINWQHEVPTELETRVKERHTPGEVTGNRSGPFSMCEPLSVQHGEE